jgi:hypothetical protein
MMGNDMIFGSYTLRPRATGLELRMEVMMLALYKGASVLIHSAHSGKFPLDVIPKQQG